MQHIDEHTLELYVLRSSRVEGKRGEIAAHLERCHGCRSLAEQMAAFYARTQEEFERPATAEPNADRRLARRRLNVIPFSKPNAEDLGLEVSSVPPTFAGRIGAFVRRNPVTAGLGSLGLAAALVVAGMLISTQARRPGVSEITDRNPALPFFNPVTEMFEVLNAEHELLWQKKSPGSSDPSLREVALRGELTVFSDLDGDGRNEVVTALAILGHGPVDVRPLIVFDGDGNVRMEKQLEAKVSYRDRKYSPYFSAQAIVILDDPAAGGKNIFVAANNSGRSPAMVRRFDSRGNLLGTYWHFGVIHGLQARDVDGDGTQELILYGKNDVDDSTHDEFAFISVLRPLRIAGERRATTCPGYLLPPSEAELYYIKVPQTDFDAALRRSSGFKAMVAEDSLKLRFQLACDKLWTLDYIIDHSMRVVEVKSYDQNLEVRRKLLAEGKVRGDVDAAYLERVRQSVRYWNGRAWTGEVSKVGPLIP